MPTREQTSVAAMPSLSDRFGGDEAAVAVAAIPEVADAHANGADGKALHAVVLRAKKTATSLERPAIDVVLRRRRAFATRLGSAPGMFTLNGIGTRLYGGAEPNPNDGTSIATLFVTLVYVPVLPLASYLVRPAAGNMLRRSWQFFAKVPLSGFHRVWRWAAFGALAALVLAIAYGVWHRTSHARLHVVNGLDVPVTARFEGETVAVPAFGEAAIEVPSGRRHVVTATAAGERVEELDLDVPGGTDLVAYVVLGASAIHVTDVEYSSSSSIEVSNRTREVVYAGSSLVTDDGVRYVFEQPPKSIRISGSGETRRVAFVASGGWRAALSAILERKDAEAAAAMVSRVAALQRDEDSIQLASSLLLSQSPERAQAYLKDLVAGHPESIEAHRAWQTLEKSQGRLDAVVAAYRADYERKPSARSGYLYARLLPQAQAAPLLATLVERFPDDPWVRRASAWSHLLAREFALAAGDYGRLREIKPADARGMLELHVTALAGAGRVKDAQRLARDAIAQNAWDALILYGRLEQLPGADASLPRARSFVETAAPPGADLPSLRADLSARTGDYARFANESAALPDEAVRDARRLDVEARTSLDAALASASAASKEVLGHIEETSRLLLACAAARVGKPVLAKTLYESGGVGGVPESAFDAPGEAAGSDDVDLATRAILEFSASRRAKDPAERDRLVSAAKSDDVLRFVVWGQK